MKETKKVVSLPKTNMLHAQVRQIWPECQERVRRLTGKRWRFLSEARVGLMAARLREFPDEGPECLVEAVEGAWASLRAWNETEAGAARFMRPETIYRPSKFPLYLETARDNAEPGEPEPMDPGEVARILAERRAREIEF